MTMIRPFTAADAQQAVSIWLAGSLQAHHFIEREYWESQQEAMAERYLPSAQTYVLEEQGRLLGFVSLMDDYLAAIFVDPTEQQRGLGQRLLNYAKELRSQLQLKVYTANEPAVRFYQKHGFSIIEETRDEATGASEWVMHWSREHN